MPIANRICRTCTEMKYERSKVAVGQLRGYYHTNLGQAVRCLKHKGSVRYALRWIMGKGVFHLARHLDMQICAEGKSLKKSWSLETNSVCSFLD